MLKKVIAHSLIFSLVFNNLAFATQSIIELDFKDSQTPQRLHVIPRMSNVGDVSHVEIDQKQQQVVVHKLNKADEGLSEQSVADEVSPVTSPVIIPSYDIQNLPWELESEKLTLFILNHTAWLSPLGEDGYKLAFKGRLLGGMKPWGGGKKELVVDVTKFTVDCKGRNDYPSGTIGAKFCNKNGNGAGNFGIPVINKPYVPPVDKEWEKHCEKACNPFGNQKVPYIPLLEDKKPDLKKVNINPVKAPDIKIDDKKIHQTVAKEVEKVMQPLINKRKAKFRHVFEEMPDIIMEELAPYRGGELPKKTLEGIISNVSWRIDGLLKDTDLFKLYWRDGTIKLENGRWWPGIVDPMSRTGVLSAYEGLKKQYAEELENFKKSQKIEKEKLEKAKKEQAIKEEQIRLEQEQSKIQKMTSPDEYDRHYIETRLLPHILKMVGHSYYPAYKDYQAFVNNLGTGYKIGMSINDYWQSWLNSKKWGEVAKKNPLPTYQLPMHLVRDQETFDKQFIETTLLPHIRKYTSHPGYKDYQSFISTTGTNYKPGMDMNAYMDLWKYWKGGVIKDFPKYGVPETCNPFYGDYEKLKRVQTLINTASWDAVYDYANKEGFSKEDVQYVNSMRTESITFDSYFKGIMDSDIAKDLLMQVSFPSEVLESLVKTLIPGRNLSTLQKDLVHLKEHVVDGILSYGEIWREGGEDLAELLSDHPALKKVFGETGKTAGILFGVGMVAPKGLKANPLKPRVFNPSKAQSPIWKELKPYRSNIKTNGETGKNKKYYKWDKLHNEIEMHDHLGNPVDALDPITGKRLFKDVSKHKPLDL